MRQAADAGLLLPCRGRWRAAEGCVTDGALSEAKRSAKRKYPGIRRSRHFSASPNAARAAPHPSPLRGATFPYREGEGGATP